MSFHLVHFLLQTLVLHLAHYGIQLLQTLCLRVISHLDLGPFYLLLKLLVVLCLITTQNLSKSLLPCLNPDWF